MIEIKSPRKVDEKKSASPSNAAIREKLLECWQNVLARPEVGFTRLAEQEADWKAIEDRARESRPSKRVLVVGIGGSSLGMQVIYEAFRHHRPVQMTFLESPDPDVWSLQRGFSDPEWRDKHIVIVSKSGNTLETLSWVERIAANEPSWLKSSQVTVVASPGEGALQKWALKEKIPTLWIPENVGGRFSVLTAAGMLPSALMGLKVSDFREGAAWALKRPELATTLSQELLASWDRGEWVTQSWTYAESLRLFGEWWQQLYSESLGKKIKRDGSPAPRASTPMSCRGPRDQHSLAQQLIEAGQDKYILVTRVRSVENSSDTFKAALFPELPIYGRQIALGRVLSAEAQSFEQALSESGISQLGISLEAVNERSLGAMFMLWQMVIAQMGEYLEINAFDQPGVELGKKFANQILKS